MEADVEQFMVAYAEAMEAAGLDYEPLEYAAVEAGIAAIKGGM